VAVVRDTQALLAHVSALEEREAARLLGGAAAGRGGRAGRGQGRAQRRGRGGGARGGGGGGGGGGARAVSDEDAALAAALGERVRRLHGQLAAAHSMTQQYYGVDDSSDYEFFDSDDAGGPDADPAGADAVVVAAATDAT
jgi:hypothetical protein